MNLEHYIIARETLINYAWVFKITALILSATFLLAVFSNYLRRRIRTILAISFLFLCISFFFIVRFHIKIHESVHLNIPGILPKDLNLYVPPWIESEKLFFWLLLFIFFAFLKIPNNADEKIKIGVSAISAAFLGLVAFYDPFSNPLPLLDAEIRQFSTAIAYFDYPRIMEFWGRATYFYNTPYMWTHPPLLFLSYSLFLLSMPSLVAGIFSEAKKTIEYESFSYQFIKAGYIFLTAGMLIGYPWAIEAWKGESWWWSPKINVSIMMWLLYSAYMHLRIYAGRKQLGKLSCALGVLSFLALVFTYITTYLIPGVHSYG